MSLESSKEQIRKAFPVNGILKKNEDPSNDEKTKSGFKVTLGRKKIKTIMSTLTIRYPLELETRLENIAYHAGLSKSEVVLEIFEQIFPELEEQYKISSHPVINEK